MGQHSDYAQVISRIESSRDVPAKIESFERFRAALREYGFRGSREGKNVFLVVGTNGKGSVAKTLETLISASGKTVGLFTSPHMIKTTERIRSHGRDLDEAEFVTVFKKVEPFVERFGLSHFETLVLMMAEVFFGGDTRPPVDVAIIEAGVGGRLDPTRLIPHDTTVVTQLGLDHQELLGPDLRSIAREKFAAIDPGNLVVHSPLPTGVSLNEITQTPAHVFEAVIHPHRIEREGREPKWVICTPWGEAPLALLGERAIRNTSLALAVLERAGYEVGSLLPALKDVRWPCRMEKFEVRGRTVYLSGDHNPQGVESLIEILSQFDRRELHLLIGVGKNKPAGAMIERLQAMGTTTRKASLHLTLTPFRSASLDSLEIWRSQVASVCADPEEALRSVVSIANPEDMIVVTGSLYLTGFLRGRGLESGFFKSE